MKRMMMAVAACSLCVSGWAIELGAPFSDGMVLQRDMKVPVWGTAAPSARVTVSFAGQTAETTAGTNGVWRVDLKPLATSSVGRDLVVTESAPSNQPTEQSDHQAVLHDVLVGEVWLCAGQSNMDAPLWSGSMHYADAKGGLRGQMTRKPLVRYCKSGQVASIRPLRQTKSRCVWRKFQPENLRAEGPCFSGVGFYFALELHNALGIPVGVVGAYWGGTTIRAWTPPEGMETVGETKPAAKQQLLEGAAFQKKVDEAKARGEKYLPQFHQQPSVIWNAQVFPFAPMAMRGFIWYQGETDAWFGHKYAPWLHALYNGWSKAFENPALKMRFAQLAPAGSGNLAPLMEGQEIFAHEEPNAKMAVISDRGAIHDWHPTDKETVGMRLAALALKYDYGWTEMKADAPTLKDWKLKDGKFVLSFDHAEGWLLYNEDWTNDNLFEVAGKDGVWKEAKLVNCGAKFDNWMTYALIEHPELHLKSDAVAEPVAVRYMGQNRTSGVLYNQATLPLGPFELKVK